ncbi:unnamed protein product [Linum tenue]|uniref:Uncharacterized protein n=2 Tax=Linum tenue TaxID=586396 RepID=A0AAV0L1U6_9ROSI|nr:unnamed protein product [Linum tenue]
MAAGAAAAATSSAPKRRTAEFHESVWGDFFITHVPETDEVVNGWNEQIEVLKSNIASTLSSAADNKTLDLIDLIERIGIDYHFEEEIEQILGQEYGNIASCSNNYKDNDNLHTVALRFRLLRQHGCNVSSDIFKRFKSDEGDEFKQEIVSDLEGLLSLYEAAYLRTQGESILDEAVDFTKPHLAAAGAGAEDSTLAERIAHALKWPHRKGMKRVEHLFFISIYGKTQGHDEAVLKLAKLSFNVVQHLYQKELGVLTKWWIELDLPKRTSYARDRLVEVYFWAIGMGCLWKPKYSLARYCFTRVTTIGSVYDDTYDAYGTIEELEDFTAAIHRWDTSMQGIEPKMKIIFEAITSSYDAIHEMTTEEFGISYCWDYGKSALKYAVSLYLEEARWLDKGYVPTFEEYRRVSSVSILYQWLAFAAFCGMGESAPKEVFDWLFTEPKLFVASSEHCRLMDDVVTHEFEQDRGHAPSSVECYMKQYGVSRKEAIDVLSDLVEENWKIINGELLNPPAHIPKEILLIFLGFGQIMEVLYGDGDGYTNSKTTTKDMLTTLLVTPFNV